MLLFKKIKINKKSTNFYVYVYLSIIPKKKKLQGSRACRARVP